LFGNPSYHRILFPKEIAMRESGADENDEIQKSQVERYTADRVILEVVSCRVGLWQTTQEKPPLW
jgi:hypothetical protein